MMSISGLSLMFVAVVWSLYYYQKSLFNPSDYRGFNYPSTDFTLILGKDKNEESENVHVAMANLFQEQNVRGKSSKKEVTSGSELGQLDLSTERSGDEHRRGTYSM